MGRIGPHAKWELLKALMLAAIYPILAIARGLPWDWWLFVSVFLIAFVLLVSFSQRTPLLAQATTPQLSPLTPAGPSPVRSLFDAEQFFHVAYCGQLQVETEGNVRAMIQSRPVDGREAFTIRFIATGLLNALYDNIWLRVYRSQLLVLAELNSKVLRLEEIRVYYDDAARKFPQVYANYSFDQWLAFLRANVLLLEYPGQVFEITVRGKDFLKYIVHCGYKVDARTY